MESVFQKGHYKECGNGLKEMDKNAMCDKKVQTPEKMEILVITATPFNSLLCFSNSNINYLS